MHPVSLYLELMSVIESVPIRGVVFKEILNYFKMVQYKIVMVRHGESEWNEKNLFCGWFDANLSKKGKIPRLYSI